MEFHEFPKALTRGDDFRVVADKAEEAEARAEGFRFWSDAEAPAADAAEEPVKRGPGRPRKTEA